MTGRLTLALLVIIPAAMAYPWQSTLDWWLLGIAVAVVIVVFAWWRGTFATTLLRRRLALLRRPDEPRHLVAHTETDAVTTVVLRILSDSDHEVPLSLLAGYLDRYGVRCQAVRVTRRDTPAGVTTWVGLTVSAAANLTALQARSADIPLRETAEVTLRRLADHLRELGFSVTTIDAKVPDVLGSQSKERWGGVQDGEHGFVACYSVPAGDHLSETLADVRATDAHEVWTVVELTGSPADPTITAVCAIRSDGPAVTPAGVQPRSGRQHATLTALHPESTRTLAAV